MGDGRAIAVTTPAPAAVAAVTKRGFIARAIAADPRAALMDGLAFLGFFRVDMRSFKARYRFADPRIAATFEVVRQGVETSQAFHLPTIDSAAKNRLRRGLGIGPDAGEDDPEVMEDYWILFHELAWRIAARVSATGEGYFVFATTYHALVHAMYNAVIHGASGEVELRVSIARNALTLELENGVVSSADGAIQGDDRPQYHTRHGIRVGGGGNSLDTFAQLFDGATLRQTPPAPETGHGRATLILRHDLEPRPWHVRLRRTFLARAVISRDLRQLAGMARDRA